MSWRLSIKHSCAEAPLKHSLLLPLAFLLASVTHAGELLIETSLADDGALLVSYTPPPGVTRLERIRVDEVSNAFWREQVRPLDDCAQIEATRVVMVADRRCQRMRLRIEPTVMARYASYEAALPMKGQGVLSFTGYYLTALEGHALRWRWLPPVGGYVMHQGQTSQVPVEQHLDAQGVSAALKAQNTHESWQRLGARQYVYLGRAPSTAIPGGTLVHDKALDETRLSVIRQMLDLSMRTLGSAYGRWPVGPVGVVVTTAEHPSFQGDVTDGRMMSLRLPRLPEAVMSTTQLQQFIAHEVTHWWNMGVFQSDSRQPWLHEGHADWSALLLMRGNDLISRREAVVQLAGALNRCMSVRGDRPAATLAAGFGGGDDPYACGLSLMFLAWVQRSDLDPAKTAAQSPLVRTASLHAYGQELDVSAFAAWADGESSGPMRRLLLDPHQSFRAGLAAMVERLGLGEVTPIRPGMVLPASVAADMAARLMEVLMATDCGGSYGFWRLPDGFRMDERLNCKTLRPGQEALAVNGTPLLGDPAGAWEAVKTACGPGQAATARSLKIRFRQGPDTDLACPAPTPRMPLSHLVVLDESALAKHGL